MIQPIAGKNRAWNAYCTGGDYGVDSQCGVVIYGLDGQTKAYVAELWNTRAARVPQGVHEAIQMMLNHYCNDSRVTCVREWLSAALATKEGGV